jgi:ribosomal protein S18 acetylase RimI-like enzyme
MNIRDCEVHNFDNYASIVYQGKEFTIRKIYKWYIEGIFLELHDSNHILLSLLCFNPGDGEISNFITDEQFRNQGYGELLLSYAIQYYDVKKLIVYETNLPALHLYEKLGFKPTGKTIECKASNSFLLEMYLPFHEIS